MTQKHKQREILVKASLSEVIRTFGFLGLTSSRGKEQTFCLVR